VFLQLIFRHFLYNIEYEEVLEAIKLCYSILNCQLLILLFVIAIMYKFFYVIHEFCVCHIIVFIIITFDLCSMCTYVYLNQLYFNVS